MEALDSFGDERVLSQCVYCGGPPDTREHVPSKVLLDTPYPPNLPVVAACKDCNSGFSLDEEYLACVVDCALAGTVSADRVSRPKVARILRQRPALLARLRTALAESEGVLQLGCGRVRRVVVKLATGHAAYELNSLQQSTPDCGVAPLPALAPDERLRFERGPMQSLWPEAGSRAMQRMVRAPVPAAPTWLQVQAGRYRYVTFTHSGRTTVRMVLSEYLASEVSWDDDGAGVQEGGPRTARASGPSRPLDPESGSGLAGSVGYSRLRPAGVAQRVRAPDCGSGGRGFESRPRYWRNHAYNISTGGLAVTSRLVRPQTLRGVRDLLPREMIARNSVIERIREVYERYGFVPIDTPVLEHLATLVGTGGEETDKLIFTLESPEKQRIGMRFDLTVPFARIVAQYVPNEIRLPFRRYHIGPVFRADDPHPEQGRFRQFTQFDIDIAGAESLAADAEIVAAMSDALQAVGLRNDVPETERSRYFIRLNSRRLVDAFLFGIGVRDAERAKHVMRVIDKRDKISPAEVEQELGPGRVDESGDEIRGVNLEPPLIAELLEFVGTRGDTREQTLKAMEGSIKPSAEKDSAIAELDTLCGHLDALGVPDEAARLDPSLARGLEYYTGPVFEGALPHAGVGSVMGGGRYDGLVSRFSDEAVPATGASIGLDRLVTGLVNVGLVASERQATADVLVLTMPGVSPREASRAAAELRRAGIAAELYLGTAEGKVARQLSFANARNMSVAVLIGDGEVAANTASVKDLREGQQAREDIQEREDYRAAGTTGQRTVPRSELATTVAALLQR